MKTKEFSRREFGKLAAMAGAASLIPAELWLTGCNVDQVVAAISTAADVAIQAGGIVTPLNPAYGAIITAAGVTLKDLAKLYADYEAAPADQKTSVLAKLQTALGIATSNLKTILADARIKAPALQAEIGVFVAVANSAISLIINHLPKHSMIASVAEIQSKQLPVISNAKSAKDLKKAWNDAVAQSHPEARI